MGQGALAGNTTGSNNTGVGFNAGRYTTAGANNDVSNNSVYIGYDARASAAGNANEIVIGHNSRGNGTNTTTLGNSSTTNTYIAAGNLRVPGTLFINGVAVASLPNCTDGQTVYRTGGAWTCVNAAPVLSFTGAVTTFYTGCFDGVELRPTTATNVTSCSISPSLPGTSTLSNSCTIKLSGAPAFTGGTYQVTASNMFSSTTVALTISVGTTVGSFAQMVLSSEGFTLPHPSVPHHATRARPGMAVRAQEPAAC